MVFPTYPLSNGTRSQKRFQRQHLRSNAPGSNMQRFKKYGSIFIQTGLSGIDFIGTGPGLEKIPPWVRDGTGMENSSRFRTPVNRVFSGFITSQER